MGGERARETQPNRGSHSFAARATFILLAHEWLAVGARLGSYEIVGVLGAGGMGESIGRTTRGSAVTSRSRSSPSRFSQDTERSIDAQRRVANRGESGRHALSGPKCEEVARNR
jgi:hypothetical protein